MDEVAMAKVMRAALYLRVSTDNQTTDNQRIALERLCEQRGWQISEIYNDNGISGAKGRKDRPRLDAMLREARKGRYDVVVVWAIDRLGRSMTHLLDTLSELDEAKVGLVVEQQQIDTTTPAGRLFFHMSGAFAEFERSLIKARVDAGIDRAKAQNKVTGRGVSDKEDLIRPLIAEGKLGLGKIAKQVGVGTGTVQRIKRDMLAEPDIRQALAEGMTNIHEIAERCGVGSAAVARIKVSDGR
jgi:DNA invertase Pin-like site-specific DNA recombinase